VTVYGPDSVLNRGPEAAFSHVSAKLNNAAGKMGKLLATDMYLDGQGTNSGTLQLDGLQAAVDHGSNYASYGGITRSDLGVANGTVSSGINGYVASFSTGFSLTGVQKAYGSAWFGNEHVDLIAGRQNVWDQFWSKLQPMQRFHEESSDVAKAGFSSFKFNSASVVVDQYAPSGEMYGLNTRRENFALYVSTLERYQFGFSGFKEAQNTDDVAGQYFFAGNLVVSNPRLNFRITSVPTL